MIQNGALYQFADTTHNKRIFGRRTLLITPELPQPTTLSADISEFDPLFYLTTGVDCLRLAMTHADPASRFPSDWQWEVNRENDLKVLTGRAESGVSFQWDEPDNSNTVIVTHHHGAMTETWTVGYLDMGTVAVPSHIQIEVAEDSGRQVLERSVQFRDSVVNQPLGEEVFSLVNLGLRSGDVIRDIRADVQYVFPGEDPVRTERPSLAADDVEDPFMLYLGLSIAGWSLLLAGVLIIRRWNSGGGTDTSSPK